MTSDPAAMPPVSERAIAAVELLRRTGASTFQLRYSDDEAPVVWMAVSGYVTDGRGRPVKVGEPNHYEAAAALDAEGAIFRLCDQLIDGGQCQHCGRPAGFDTEPDSAPIAEQLICWYQYDPELKTFRRGCEGDT